MRIYSVVIVFYGDTFSQFISFRAISLYLSLQTLTIHILREQLTKSKDTIINIQQNEINKSERVEVETKRQNEDLLSLKQKLQEKEFEANRLGKSVEDLQHELETVNRRVSRDYDDEVKEDGRRRQGFGDAIAVNVNVGVHGDNGGGLGDTDDEQPLLGKKTDANDDGDKVEEENGKKKRSRRHRRNSVERIGQTPREFFLDNHWACGFVCCNHAFGCGSY